MERKNFNLNLIKKWKNLSFKDFNEIAKDFDELSYQYEPFLISQGNYKVWKYAYKYIPNFIKNDDLIFDLCCGTGLVGEVLNEKGYNNIIGIDISFKMLERLRVKEFHLNKKIYKERINVNILNYKPKVKAKLSICVGAMTYFKDKIKFINYILDNYSNYFLFTERNDLIDEYKINKNFQIIDVSKDYDYLPNLEEYKNINVKFYLLGKT